MIAHLTAPRLVKRLAIGIENALAHAVVDRLLGYDRAFAESRLQLTPVEWGIWTFLILRALDGLDASTAEVRPAAPDEARSIGPGDLRLDRAGPDPFDPTGLGSIVTVRWGVRVGTVSGSVRLWIPESLLRHRLESPVPPSSPGGEPMTVADRRSRPDRPARRAVEPLAGRGRDRRDAPGLEAAAGRRRPAAHRLPAVGLARQPGRAGRPGPGPRGSGRPVPHPHSPRRPTRAAGSSAWRTGRGASLVPATRSSCPSRIIER